MALAPIALFVYNRLEHTKQVVETLLRNNLAQESKLFIFSDGPKNVAAASAVEAVREYVKAISGFAEVVIIERNENYGLAKSIISGVGEILAAHDRVIVLEDDLVTSPHFLQYMNDGLDLYKDVHRVASVHGYVYPVEESLPETFFIRGADCWGWATWKRAWDVFEPNGNKLLHALEAQKLTEVFDMQGAYPYTTMLKSQIKGFNHSWAILWHASAFLRDLLTLYPGQSLVRNIGFDKSGTHVGTTNYFAGTLSTNPIRVRPHTIGESAEALRAFQHYFSSWKMKLFKVKVRVRYILNCFKVRI